MTTIQLYTGGGVSLSPIEGDGRRVSNYVRLLAGDEKAITNGEIVTACTDILLSQVSLWQEIDAPVESEEIDDTEAIGIIFGGES